MKQPPSSPVLPPIETLDLDLDAPLARPPTTAKPAPRPVPRTPSVVWRAEAVILPIRRQTCRTCGTITLQSAGEPLARFRRLHSHLLNETWATLSPASLNPSLPRETVLVEDSTVSHCPACFHPTGAQAALPLWFDLDPNPVLQPCATCSGTGKVVEPHRVCLGAGCLECQPISAEADLPHGQIELPCRLCHGSGIHRPRSHKCTL